ncbi:hypothetical protein [uncultured Roseobacter sp.]|uniref:hypothetical protein n=1 Tax=uncultured Roseobacter sp. TaxID=114847 RepID=UPI002604BF4B|nr:hypothetical protein [uncultured Roseobacter sp.]
MTPEQMEIIKRARQRKIIADARARMKPETGVVEQGMSGVNEGIALTLGAPVDLMTCALNLGARGINAITGSEIPQIESPVGGSDTMRSMLKPTISETEPQTAQQRYARRIGQEVGATAIPGGVFARGAASPAKAIAGMGASAVGAGVGGQTSREIAPESDAADLIASLLGGGSVVAERRSMRPGPKAPSLDDLKSQSAAGYDSVRESGARLTPQSSSDLAASIEDQFGQLPATRRLNPKAAIAAEEIAGDMRTSPPTISEVDEARCWIGQNVAGSREAGERRLGAMMKGKIDDHLDNLSPADVTGTNRSDEVVATLKDAREKAHRVHKSQIFEAEDTGAIEKGLRRAATTGTGGNEINAIRQNVRRVLKSPKIRRGFKGHELQAMRDIADGTPTQNAMRLLGRLAPTSGALPLDAGAGGAGIAASTGNPLFMPPSGVGMVAKGIGERSTRKQVDALGELIRNGAPLPKKGMSDIERRITEALLSAQAIQATPQLDGVKADIAKALARWIDCKEQALRLTT